jgi:hypothetical protein
VGSVVYGTEAGIFRKTLGVPTVVCGPGDIAQAHQPERVHPRLADHRLRRLHATHDGVVLPRLTEEACRT